MPRESKPNIAAVSRVVECGTDAQIVGREPVITLWGQNVSTKTCEEKFYPGLEHVLASTTPNLAG